MHTVATAKDKPAIVKNVINILLRPILKQKHRKLSCHRSMALYDRLKAHALYLVCFHLFPLSFIFYMSIERPLHVLVNPIHDAFHEKAHLREINLEMI